jgi:two-component system LytT family response regulator
MIRAFIVDDAPLAREGIRVRLQDHEDMEIVGEAGDGPAAVEAIRHLLPHLLFLDVQMPGYNGFEVLKRIGSACLPLVIFTTAYETYAVKAFDAHAVDYLLKPIDGTRFQEAIRRARAALSCDSDLERAHHRMADLLQSHDQQSGVLRDGSAQNDRRFLTRFAVRDGDRFILLKTEDVNWIKSAGDYVELQARERSSLVRMTMSELEQKLDPRQFVRIHRSAIINLDSVDEIRPQDHGDYKVVLRDTTVLRLSRSYRERLLP